VDSFQIEKRIERLRKKVLNKEAKAIEEEIDRKRRAKLARA
jgi:hypothetical protein